MSNNDPCYRCGVPLFRPFKPFGNPRPALCGYCLEQDRQQAAQAAAREAAGKADQFFDAMGI